MYQSFSKESVACHYYQISQLLLSRRSLASRASVCLFSCKCVEMYVNLMSFKVIMEKRKNLFFVFIWFDLQAHARTTEHSLTPLV